MKPTTLADNSDFNKISELDKSVLTPEQVRQGIENGYRSTDKDLLSNMFSNNPNIYDLNIYNPKRDFRVDTSGDIYIDSNNGLDTNTGTASSPIQTISKVVAMISSWATSATKDLKIIYRTGIYELESTLTITTAMCNATYKVIHTPNYDECVVFCPKMYLVKDGGANPLGKSTDMAYTRNLRPLKCKSNLGKKAGGYSLSKNGNTSVNYTNLGDGNSTSTIKLDEVDQDVLLLNSQELYDLHVRITQVYTTSIHSNSFKSINDINKTLILTNPTAAGQDDWSNSVSTMKISYGAPYLLINYKYGIGDFYTSSTNVYLDNIEECLIPKDNVKIVFDSNTYNWSFDGITFTGFNMQTSSSGSRNMQCINAAYTTGIGITINNCKFIYTMGVTQAKNSSIFTNNTMFEIFQSGVYVEQQNGNNVLIKNNTLFNIGTKGFGSSIYASGTNITIEDNRCFNGTWNGIRLDGQWYNVNTPNTGSVTRNVVIGNGYYNNKPAELMKAGDGGLFSINGRNGSICNYVVEDNIFLLGNYYMAGRAAFLDDAMNGMTFNKNLLGACGVYALDLRQVGGNSFNNNLSGNLFVGSVYVCSELNKAKSIVSKNYISKGSNYRFEGNVIDNNNMVIDVEYKDGMVKSKEYWTNNCKMLYNFFNYENVAIAKFQTTYTNPKGVYLQLLGDKFDSCPSSYNNPVYFADNINNGTTVNITDGKSCIINSNNKTVHGVYVSGPITVEKNAVTLNTKNPTLIKRLSLANTSGYQVEPGSGGYENSARSPIPTKVIKPQSQFTYYRNGSFPLTFSNDFTININLFVYNQTGATLSTRSEILVWFGTWGTDCLRFMLGVTGGKPVIGIEMSTSVGGGNLIVPIKEGFNSVKVRFLNTGTNTYRIISGEVDSTVTFLLPATSAFGWGDSTTAMSSAEISMIRIIDNLTNTIKHEFNANNINPATNSILDSITKVGVQCNNTTPGAIDYTPLGEHYNPYNMEGYSIDSLNPNVKAIGLYMNTVQTTTTGTLTTYQGKHSVMIPYNASTITIPDFGESPINGVFNYNSDYIFDGYYLCIGKVDTGLMEIYKGDNLNYGAIRASCGWVKGVTYDVRKSKVLLNQDGRLNVKAFGAKGDGINDDTAAIEAANLYAKLAASGLILYFPSGKYNITNMNLYSNVNYVGDGRNSTVLKLTAATGFCRNYMQNHTNISISNICFDFNSINTGAAGFSLHNSFNNFSITHCSFLNNNAVSNIYPAIRLGLENTRSFNIIFNNNYFYNCPFGGISILSNAGAKGSRTINVLNNTFELCGDTIIGIHAPDLDRWSWTLNVKVNYNNIINCSNTGTSGPIPVEVWGINGLEQIGNYIDSGTRGLSFGAHNMNTIASNNIVKNQTTYGGEGGPCINAIITDNTFINCKCLTSFTYSPSASNPNGITENLIISNNTVIGGKLPYVDPTGGIIFGSISNQVFKNLLITNNNFNNPYAKSNVIKINSSSSQPTVRFTGDGTGAAGYAQLIPVSVVVIDGGINYTAPTVVIQETYKTGSGASVSLTITDGVITGGTIITPGTTYISEPEIRVTDSTGSGAVIKLVMGVESIYITNQGNGYTTASVTVNGSGGYGFIGTPIISGSVITGVTVTNRGAEYGRGSNISVTDNKFIIEHEACPESIINVYAQEVYLERNNITMKKYISNVSTPQESYSIIHIPHIVADINNVIPNILEVKDNRILAVNRYHASRTTFSAIGINAGGGLFTGIKIVGNVIEGAFRGNIIAPVTSSPDLIVANNDTFNTVLTGEYTGRILGYQNNILRASATAIPTTGTWKAGCIVENETPTILGTTGSKYIINGWKRITNGSSHILNTDWVELRVLTGA